MGFLKKAALICICLRLASTNRKGYELLWLRWAFIGFSLSADKRNCCGISE